MHRHALISVVLGASLVPGAAWASGSHPALGDRSYSCGVDQEVATFALPVPPDRQAAFRFTGMEIRRVDAQHGYEYFRFRVEDDAVLVNPLGSEPDATLSLFVVTAQPTRHLNLLIYTADKPDHAIETCQFRDWMVISDFEEARSWRFGQVRQRLFMDSAAREPSERMFEPAVRDMTGPRGQVQVALGRGAWIDGEFWTTFIIHNHDWRPYRLHGVQLMDRYGFIMSLRDVALDSPAMPMDIADRRPGDDDALRNRYIAMVPPGQSARGFVRLPNVDRLMEPSAIMFGGFTGPRMLVAMAEEPVWIWVPKREDQLKQELEEERRRKEKEARNRAAHGIISLSLEALGGVAWLGDGLGLERTDATLMKGLGMRLTYNVNTWLAFQTSALGASTGEAYFPDIQYGGMQGELRRRAALGRVLLGARMHLREGTSRPALHVGLGVEGKSHDSRFKLADGATPEESSLEFKVIQSFGIGLDAQLGPNLLAGFALSAVARGWGDELRALEAGIYLGYSTGKP